MTAYDLDQDLAGLAPEHAAGVAAAAPRSHGEALCALVETMTQAYPDRSADGVIGRQVGDTLLTFGLLDDGKTMKVSLSGAVDDTHEVHGLVALEYNTREWIAQAMRG